MEPGIALFGGVFDPPHNGHLALAHAALEALPIESVHFLIAGIPPHKPATSSTPPGLRLAMLEIAVGDAPGLRIDARELRRTGPSYTVLTLEEIRGEHPDRRLFFLIGGDNVRSIGTWYRPRRVFELADVVVMPRPGEPRKFTPEDVPFVDDEKLRRLNAAFLDPVEVPASSTTVRERVRDGLPITGMVPELVERLIREHGLYRT